MRPALIIGVPVGFVNVVYAKEVIMEAGVPYIVAKGRKGGSTIAAAICNALIYRLTRGGWDAQRASRRPQFACRRSLGLRCGVPLR